jgi:AraC family transcriptional regulator
VSSDPIRIQAGKQLLRPGPAPLLASSAEIWPGIRLEVNYVPEGEMPPLVAFDRHLISVNLGPKPLRRYWRRDGREQSANFSPGNIGLISRQPVAGMRFGGSHRLLVLGIDDLRLNQVLEEELSGRPAEFEVVPSSSDPILHRLLRLLEQEAALGHPGGRLFGDSVTNAIICHSISRYGTVRPPLKSYHRGLSGPRLRRVLDYVDASLETNFGVTELASIAGLSQFHFAKLFRQSTGRSIHQYVLDTRIERARQLIRQNRMSLGAIGAQVGIPNPSQFSATFHRRAGLSPTDYHRQLQLRRLEASLSTSPFL